MSVDINVKWNNPESIPDVGVGTEELYWVAVENEKGRRFVYDSAMNIQGFMKREGYEL